MELKVPDLSPKPMILDLRYANKLLGMKFKGEEVKDLLLRMGFDVELGAKAEENENLRVLIPPYRVDILHQIDLVEDIAIAYGYENFIPENIKVYSMGRKGEFEKFTDSLRQTMTGYGFSEIMSLIMTNKKELFEKMNLKESGSGVVETENAISSDYCVMRSWLLPSLMSFLEKNRTKGYPQNLFEIGKCVELNELNGRADEKEKLSFVAASAKTNFSEVKAITEGFLNFRHETIALKHESFIEGRTAGIIVNGRCAGFFGEVHPKVLENFSLEVPVTAFELDINEVYEVNL